MRPLLWVLSASSFSNSAAIWASSAERQAEKIAVRQADVILLVEFPAEVILQRGAVSNVFAVLMLQVAKVLDELFFELPFEWGHYLKSNSIRPTPRAISSTL